LPRKCSPSTKSDHNAKALFGIPVRCWRINHVGWTL
jgi:hypothetical protein